ncbi:MAG TPA: choice-of-anchor D domain-containing protein [Actinocrinis sp.]|nr:choice-of-anchor D domain-containing protein [Actinocrinis sp.]
MSPTRAGGRSKLRRLAASTATVLAVPLISAVGIVAPAHAAASAGAPVPFTEYNAGIPSSTVQTNGTILGPDYDFGTLPSEATGRVVDQLVGQGSYVSFTLTTAANAVDFHYSIPDSLAGGGIIAPLDMYVNNSLTTALSLTSQYSWLYGSNPPTENNAPQVTDPNVSAPHDMYNDVRYMFGSTLAAGTVVKLQVDSADTAPWYAINTADFEQVAALLAAPAGYINVTQAPYNVDNTGATDVTSELQTAIQTAESAGTGVYLPQGTYQISSPLQVNKLNLAGAGEWYTKITGTDVELAGNGGNDDIHDLSLFGTVNVRNDGDGSVNGLNGNFSNSTVSNVWIQNTKVGMWITGSTTGLTINGARIQDTNADGVNFDGNVNNSTVENSFLRNTQDDGLAIWASPNDDSDTFTQNTVDSPGIANNVAIYGGSNITVTNNLLQDTVTRGGGIHFGNRFGASAMAGTITVSGNVLNRDGQFDPGWDYGVGAIWFWPQQENLDATVNIDNNQINNSPYEAFMFQNSTMYTGSAVQTGNGGNTISNVHIDNNTVNGVGTYVLQEQAAGAVEISGLVATNVGVSGQMNCANTSDFTITQGSGNSGWSSTSCPMPAAAPLYVFPTTTTFENAAVGQATPVQQITVFNKGSAAATLGAISPSSGFSVTQDPSHPCGPTLGATEPGDNSVWCSVDVSFTAPASGITKGTLTIPSNQPGSPTVVQLIGSTGGTNVINPPTVTPGSLSFGYENVGSTTAAQTVTVANPSASALTISSIVASGAFAETNTCGSSIAAGGSCTVSVKFTPTAGGSQTGELAISNSATSTPIGAGLSGIGLSSTTNLAQTASISASSSDSGFPASNVNDGNTSSYWESNDGAAYPQTLTANLGQAFSLGSVTLDLPPSSAWSTRTQTLSILGSSNGTSFTTLVPSATYTFNPATGNTVSVNLPSGTNEQYLELSFTANSGWTAAQLSELQIFPGSGGSTPPPTATLTASPTSVSFGSQTVGSTSAGQNVTITNTGGASASISSISAGSPFGESSTCGSTLASGASCTATVSFSPTAAGAASGSLTVSSNATDGTLTVALSGTGTSAATETLTATPTSVAFGSEAVGSTTAAQTVTIKNTGTAAASISSVSTAAPFHETTTCGSSLAAGASCTASVTFAPTANGAVLANLTVSSNAANGTLNVALSGTGTGGTATPVNLALNAPITASSYTQTYTASSANDGNTSTYWEGSDGAWPTTLAVNLGASDSVSSVVVDLPPSSSWGTRTQTFSVLGSTNGSTYSTLVGSATYTFNPATGNTVSITLPAGSTDQYVELSFTGNSVQNGAQVSEFQVWGTSSSAPNPDLALNKSITASSYTQMCTASNADDGNTSTYWEGTNGAWPTTLTVDLGSSQTLGSVTLNLPPSTSWGTRTQTLSVLGSTNGSTYSTLVGSATYTFNPATGNTVSITLPAGTSDRYVQLSFTANNVQNGAQLSEFQIFG